jgi:hypothetical protein
MAQQFPTYTFVPKLTRWLEKRYDCRVEIQSVENLQHDLVSEIVAENRPLRFHDRTFFPLLINDTVEAVAMIDFPTMMDNSELGKIAELLQLVVDSHELGLTRLEEMEVLERNLSGHDFAGEVNVDFETGREDLAVQMAPSTQEESAISVADAASTIRRQGATTHAGVSIPAELAPTLIESPHSTDAYKLTHELHVRSHRFAMLPLADLSPVTFADRDSILSLGPITIFIPELTEAPRMIQKEIANYYLATQDESEFEMGPVFVISSRLNRMQLAKSNLVNADLVRLISSNVIMMSHSFAHYKTRNLLDYICEALTPSTRPLLDV